VCFVREIGTLVEFEDPAMPADVAVHGDDTELAEFSHDAAQRPVEIVAIRGRRHPQSPGHVGEPKHHRSGGDEGNAQVLSQRIRQGGLKSQSPTSPNRLFHASAPASASTPVRRFARQHRQRHQTEAREVGERTAHIDSMTPQVNSMAKTRRVPPTYGDGKSRHHHRKPSQKTKLSAHRR